MSLNNPSQDPSSPPTKQDPPTTIPPGITDRHTHEVQEEATDPITSPHGTTDEYNAVEPHNNVTAAQPPSFQPFFTLIEDKQTGEYYHPTVHYIFSDDDTDIVTAAALRSLETQQDALSSSKKEQIHSEDTEPLDQEKTALLPPAIPGVRDHYLVLDVEPVSENTAIPGTQPTSDVTTGPATQLSTSPSGASVVSQPQAQFRVTAAKSFSPSWQVLQSEMVPAPTFENNEASDATPHGLMLKIHGTGGLPYVPDSGKEHGPQRLEEMMDQFAKRMSELQTVIDAVGIEPQSTEEEAEKGQGQEGELNEKEKGEEPSAGIGEAELTEKKQ